ncbi:MAG: nuclear transport factor 2 family protein [Jatrophihabitans sp.]
MGGFRAAVQAHDLAAIEAVLHPQVVFRSPAVHRPYEGRAATLVLLGAVIEVFEDFSYVGQLVDGDQEMLRFAARIGDRTVDGIDLLRYDETGLVIELSVFVRPFSGLTALKDAMAARLG